MIGVAIIAAEMLFWVFLVGGLLVRYALRWKTVGISLLVLTPVIDLVLIGMTYSDLSKGGESHFSHGLSAFYVGFSITFGPSIIAAMDRKFAARYSTNGTDDPAKHDKPSYVDHLQSWRKACIAVVITLALLTVGLFVAGFSNSFWLIYWMITAVSIVPMWWFTGPMRARRHERSRSHHEPGAQGP